MHQAKVAADEFRARVTNMVMHNRALAVLFLEKPLYGADKLFDLPISDSVICSCKSFDLLWLEAKP